jgi:hypothetical protein
LLSPPWGIAILQLSYSGYFQNAATRWLIGGCALVVTGE